ncbi:hypothetical protein BH10BAC3_BH10BAC3_21340 [soil metagenome]
MLLKQLFSLYAASFLLSFGVLAQGSYNELASYKNGNNLNITSFGTLKSWKKTTDLLGENITYTRFNADQSNDSTDIGVSWWESRDVERVEIVFKGASNRQTQIPMVQYWFQSWPQKPPRMPSTEDYEDDPWQGVWLTAAMNATISDNTATLDFKPMSVQENKNAADLPGSIIYRRTLKMRLVFAGKHPDITAVNFFSTSKIKSESVRIELLESNTSTAATLDVFNGKLKSISGYNWDKADKKNNNNSFSIGHSNKPKGIVANVYTATQSLPGSNDETVVTMHSASGTFSFSLNDVEKGPVYIPFHKVYITKTADPIHFSPANYNGTKTTRERILDESEQTYERARKEIPHLDPTNRGSGGPIDLPLAADASWQKFSVQWGGNILLNKVETKAQGKELLRCNWLGNDLRWSIGTGKKTVFVRTLENCRMNMLNDYLPVVQAAWNQDGLTYREEAFSVLLRGPLSPEDPARDEQTPSVLMVKLVVSNPGILADTANILLAGNKALKTLSKEGNFLLDKVDGKTFVRGYFAIAKNNIGTQLVADSNGKVNTLQNTVILPANSSDTLYFSFPFVGDITAAEGKEMAALNYDIQKERVTKYWRDIVEKSTIFNVPEPKFNEMAKAIIPHIRISVTKEPTSGLYMVPAAALSYKVYPNEAVFQILLMERFGDFKTTADYLNTFLQLQGSSKLPGTFTGDQKEVFFGTKVDSVHNFTEENGYNMHHGTVLWGLARHYLYSGDKDWLKTAAPHMIKAADWIMQQREQTKQLDENGSKAVHYGLLPAGVLEDVHDWEFWYATNAYSCMGMEAMAKAFEKGGLPEAATYKAAAKAYHDDIRRSIETASELAPVVRLRNNTYVPWVPSQPHQRFRYFGTKKAEYYDRYQKNIYPTLRLSAIREALYGPVVLLKSGLIDATEPMAGWVLDDWEDNLTLSSSLNLNVHGRVEDEYWFSQGGMVFQANLINPVNSYLQRHEIPATIRGLYDNFVSCLYPDVNANTEEFHEWGHGSGPFYKCPDEARFVSQVCDLLVAENKEEIWLGAGTPRRWLEPGQNIELKKAQTAYGEISFSMHAGAVPGTIEASIEPTPARCAKLLLFVRAPSQMPIAKVLINGKESKDWNATNESIVIPQTGEKVNVVVFY